MTSRQTLTESCHVFHSIDPNPADGYLALTLEMQGVFPNHWVGRCRETNTMAKATSRYALRQALQKEILADLTAAQEKGNLPAALEKLTIEFHLLNPGQTPPPELNEGRFLFLGPA